MESGGARECRNRPLTSNTLKTLALVVLLSCASAPLPAQQSNSTSGIVVQFRVGPGYPVVADAPNNGTLTIATYGHPGMPYVLMTGPLNGGAGSTPIGQLDVGTPPTFNDLVMVGVGLSTGSNLVAFTVPQYGFDFLTTPVPLGPSIALPPIQGLFVDPAQPFGYSLSAASQITLKPKKSILFIQGDYSAPGFGITARLSDTSPVGYSTLKALLQTVGFGNVDEVVDSNRTITTQLLAPYGVVVLGSNRRLFSTAEILTLQNWVVNGGGLVTYADSQFGPTNWASDNLILNAFGFYVAQDNFGGVVTATNFVPHPVTASLASGVAGEGVSLIEIAPGTSPTYALAPSTTNGPACFPLPPSPLGTPNPVFTAIAARPVGAGRVVSTYDRNTFFNSPGFGTNIGDASNSIYAINVFMWAGGY